MIINFSTKLRAIRDLDRLERLGDVSLTARSWDEFLAHASASVNEATPIRVPKRSRASLKTWIQGFADMSGIDGFDTRAYVEHYDMSDEGQQTSAYGIAMDAHY